MEYLYLASGAVLGAGLRHGCQLAFARWSTWPLGTLIANLLGCLAIGYCYSQSEQWPAHLKIAVMTGFLGALTTMSSFILDIFKMAQERRWWALGVWLSLTIIGGLLACLWGYFLGQGRS